MWCQPRKYYLRIFIEQAALPCEWNNINLGSQHNFINLFLSIMNIKRMITSRVQTAHVAQTFFLLNIFVVIIKEFFVKGVLIT